MSHEPDYVVEIAGLEETDARPAGPVTVCGRRRWIGIHFECCGLYARIYRNKDGTAYTGHCPRCARPIKVRIAPDGVDCRFFRAH